MDEYFGDIVFEFDLRRAIDERYLTPYRYHPVFIELTADEAEAYQRVSQEVKGDKNNQESESVSVGKSHLTDSQRSILDSAIGKFIGLRELLRGKGRMTHCLFYCGVGSLKFSDGERVRNLTSVAKILGQEGWNVGKITADENASDRARILSDFRNERLDALVSIRVLDEGIDIPACHTAFILASQDSIRQGIQRRGRVLRLADGKDYADLYDFIFTGPFFRDADVNKLYDREFKRAKLFAKDSLNSDECMREIESKFAIS
jgi:superfamily II DNA or RNA helicase